VLNVAKPLAFMDIQMTKPMWGNPLFPRQDRKGEWYIGTAGLGWNLADHCIADVEEGESYAHLFAAAPELYLNLK
jgi:hypothetical protein